MLQGFIKVVETSLQVGHDGVVQQGRRETGSYKFGQLPYLARIQIKIHCQQLLPLLYTYYCAILSS